MLSYITIASVVSRLHEYLDKSFPELYLIRLRNSCKKKEETNRGRKKMQIETGPLINFSPVECCNVCTFTLGTQDT